MTFQVLTAADRVQLIFDDGPSWGSWRFEPSNLTLVWDGYYEIDLEEINTSAALLDWLFQCQHRDIHHLMAAFTYIFRPQATICSYGSEKAFSGSQLAKAYRDKKFPKRKPLKPSIRYSILERDGFRCQACGASAADGAVLHVDHIVAVAKGGSNDPSNLQALCADCNLGKGAR